MLAAHIFASLAVAYTLYSLSEYSVHRFAMHRMRLAKLFNSESMRQMVKNHMARHHKRDYLHDTHDEDDRLIHMQLAGLVPVVFAEMIFFFVDPITCVVVFAFGVVYSSFWWIVHNEMHRTQGRFFSRTAVYRYLEWRHQLHHEYPNINYNVILPFGDWLLGTMPTAAQIAASRRKRAASTPAMEKALTTG